MDDIAKAGKELVDKSYQLQGVFSNFARQIKPEHANYLGKTAEEIRCLGKTLQDNIMKIKLEMTNLRKELANVMKDNISLKRKFEQLQEEDSLYSLDESDMLSSQGQSTPKRKALKTSTAVNIKENTQASTSKDGAINVEEDSQMATSQGENKPINKEGDKS